MELTVQKREIFGRGVKNLRKQGLVPAEFYGHNAKNISFSVAAKEFSKVFKEAGESTVLKLVFDNEKINVLIHDVDRNPLTDEILHIDFYGIKMDQKIKIKVPILFIGEAPAVKEQGGVVVKAINEIEVEALPADLPHHIEVDLSALSAIGNSIFVKDFNINKGVKVLVDFETVVATIIEQVKEEIIAPVASVEDIKVETEEKKEARTEAKIKEEQK
ncbi:MAG: 50S ribosomal protein L25 [Patescibacteria group bacterium]